MFVRALAHMPVRPQRKPALAAACASVRSSPWNALLISHASPGMRRAHIAHCSGMGCHAAARWEHSLKALGPPLRRPPTEVTLSARASIFQMQRCGPHAAVVEAQGPSSSSWLKWPWGRSTSCRPQASVRPWRSDQVALGAGCRRVSSPRWSRGPLYRTPPRSTSCLTACEYRWARWWHAHLLRQRGRRHAMNSWCTTKDRSGCATWWRRR
mmetsp:Transcript_15524/g.32823  ORF Transcript_15524/g.32823 Transcript_15524/m.32823 type:complete len:211 (-) Transcript_15524:83-715(-)